MPSRARLGHLSPFPTPPTHFNFVVRPREVVYRIGIRMPAPPRILYCNCSYAQIVPKEVKEAVLRKLCDSGVAFDAVADLCEMSARRDPALKRLADGGQVKIAACYPRAVKWLFAAAQAPLPPDQTEVLNMRVESSESVCAALFNPQLTPNLPEGKAKAIPTPGAASP